MGYTLSEKVSNMRDTFVVRIKADSNDADYMYSTMRFGKFEFEARIRELVNLQVNYGGSHELENYPNPMDLNIPYNGWDGNCHTLEELTIEYIDENGKVFDVEIFDDTVKNKLEEFDALADRVEEFLDSQDLDYTPSVGYCDEDWVIWVSVEAYEVVDDTRGCFEEIISLVEGEFPEMTEVDVECHEMVMVTFKVDGFEVEEDDE